MPDITNVQAVKFANEKLRPLADLIERCRRTAQQFAIDIVAEFEAHVGANAGSDVIIDGSATDGRQVLTKDDVAALKYVAEQMVVPLTANDAVAVVGKVSVNGAPLY